MKKYFLLGITVAALAAAALMAQQTKVNPTDPQPACNMCPGTYIPVSELEAYTKKALTGNLLDQQVKDIEIGKANIGIGMVHRGKAGQTRCGLGCRACPALRDEDQIRPKALHLIGDVSLDSDTRRHQQCH